MGRREPRKGSKPGAAICHGEPRHAFFTPLAGKCRYLAAFPCPGAPEKGKLPGDHPRGGRCTQISSICIEPGRPATRPIHEPIKPAMQTTSDEVLIARIAGGDRLAMQVLFATAPCSCVPVRAASGAQRSDGGRLDQRGVPRHLAASREVRGPLRRLDLDVEHRAVQGPVGATAPAGGGTGRRDGGADRGSRRRSGNGAGEEGQELRPCGNA